MLSWNELQKITTELRAKCVGGQVQKIRQPDSDTVVLRVRRSGHSVRLVLSAGLPVARIAEAEADGPTVDSPTAICHWLRSVARGRPLVDLILSPNDRVVCLCFPEGKLYLECIGFGASLLGVDGDGRVVATNRPSRMREPLELGQMYEPPITHAEPTAREPRFHSALDVEAHAQAIISRRVEESTVADVLRLMGQARKRLVRLERNVQGDLERCEGAETWRERGELLKASLHLIQPGMTEVEVTDWYAEGMPKRVIHLDPRLTPQGNVERIFRRYRKGTDGRERADARVLEVMALREAFEAIDSEKHDPESCRLALVALGLSTRKGAAGHKSSGSPRRLPYLLFISNKGERILVGRGGKDNHATTFKFAKGNDHWLHVRDCPGAHVIVPLPGRGVEPQPETLLDAAALAVHHSKLRGEPGVAIAHTRRKHVKPVKGGPPGLVTMAGSKSLEVFDVDRRITRLYAERTDSVAPR